MSEPLAYELVAIADVPAAWEAIFPRLARATPSPTAHRQIYGELLTGTAHLFHVEQGFFILSFAPDPDTGDAECLVWEAVADGVGNIPAYQPLIIALAKRYGAKTLTMRTSRPGFARALDSEWKVRHVEYVRPI